MAGAISSSSSTAAPSATIITCINDILESHQLLEEVLIRVPLRDVFRCTSVCKLWLSCIRDNPYFKKRFIQQQRMMINADDDQQQLTTCLPCGSRQRLLASTPTCNMSSSVLNGLDLSLDFLPLEGCVVVGSSNGLLLCCKVAALPSSCETWPEAYYVCNPLTKQWLALPQPPDDLVDEPPFYSDCVGFISDPFYQDEGNLVTLNDGFGFTVVCNRYYFPLEEEEEEEEEERDVVVTIEIMIFSSKTGCWTRYYVPVSKVLRFKQPEAYPKNAVSDGSQRLYWLLNSSRVLIFDASEVKWKMAHPATPLDAFCTFSVDGPGKLVPFHGLSICQGTWWAGQIRYRKLRVYILIDGDWCLKHDVGILDRLDCTSSSVTYDIRCGRRVDFHGMHPSDPMVGYLSVGTTFLECNFKGRTLKLVDDDSDENGKRPRCVERSTLLPLWLPLWPTPLPAIPIVEAVTNVDD